MARRNDTQGATVHSCTAPQDRFLTVSLYPEAVPHSPWIRLRGRWLEQAGFAPQTRIRVRVLQGCLVITAEQPSP
jgi:hypothetical protein